MKNSLYTLSKMCITSLLCGPWADLWPLNGLYCKRISLYILGLAGDSGEAARRIHRWKTATNSLQRLHSPPNSS